MTSAVCMLITLLEVIVEELLKRIEMLEAAVARLEKPMALRLLETPLPVQPLLVYGSPPQSPVCDPEPWRPGTVVCNR